MRVTALLLALVLTATAAAAPPPPDPGSEAKTPQDLGNDPNKIKPYVDAVYQYGLYLFNRNDIAGAKRYWSIIKSNFKGAKEQITLIDAYLLKAKAEGLTDAKGDVKPPPPVFEKGSGRLDDDEDDGSDPVPDGPPSEPGGTAVEKIVALKRQREASEFAKSMSIETFRIGASATTAGSYQHLELIFRHTQPAKYLTIVWYAYGSKGGKFKTARTYLGPTPNKRHAVAAAYDRAWTRKYGNCIAAHVQVFYGPRREKIIVNSREVHHRKAPAKWWNKGRFAARLGFYRPKQNSFETHTLRPIDRSYWAGKK